MPVLQIKPQRWMCAVTSLAMALDMSVESVIDEIGHDGSDIIFPLLNEPKCRRGYHSQELIKQAWQHGFAMTPIELFPETLSMDQTIRRRVWTEEECWERFTTVVGSTRGILEGRGMSCLHAVYNHYGTIYDPDGYEYEYSQEECERRQFYASRLWIFTEVA